MSWRVIAAVVIFVFTMIALQPLLGSGLFETKEAIMDTGDYNRSEFDEGDIDSIYGTLLNGVLLATVGIMFWGVVRVIRKERGRFRR